MEQSDSGRQLTRTVHHENAINAEDHAGSRG
jgi:hypothetical protein